MLDDFLFRGEDIARYGAVAAFGASMTVGSTITRSAYDLPGGGSLLIGDDRYGEITTSVTLTPADGVVADESWRRRILGWLQGGRGELIVKHSPEIFRIAQFDSAPTFGTRDWPLGALTLRATVQGIAHAVRESGFSARTQGGAATIAARYDTALAAPLCVEIAPVSGTVTEVSISVSGRTLYLDGMSLSAGSVLRYDAGDAHRGVPASLSADGVPAWSFVRRWQTLRVPGGGEVAVTASGGEADIQMRLRGRWPG